MVQCPVCEKEVAEQHINQHLDSGCVSFIADADTTTESESANARAPATNNSIPPASTARSAAVPSIFKTPASKIASRSFDNTISASQPSPTARACNADITPTAKQNGTKRPLESTDADETPHVEATQSSKKPKLSAIMQMVAPLAERMRPRTLDDVHGQELVGPTGILRGLIEQNRIPSMILWGGPGTGKTTIARLIAFKSGCRFVEINSTSTGVGECKKLFAEARSELALTGRKTIIFCDEIHRFNKAQQDVFLGPVEAGQVTLIGATTENPSFKVVNALLSRCRTFTLAKLTDQDLVNIMERAVAVECASTAPTTEAPRSDDEDNQRQEEEEGKTKTNGVEDSKTSKPPRPPLITPELLIYLATFSDGDARTALNLLDLALSLTNDPTMTIDTLKKSLTKTLVYDRAGDQHYDTISAFHKSIRGSDPDAALYYLARMLQSGEDPMYIARRMIVIASEDVGLADNSMLGIATAAYTAAEKVGLPEARINLAHCTVALSLAPKSTRSYRALKAATSVLSEPGMAGLPIPIHLRNAPTRLMKELGYGREYKYPPEYVDGKVAQEYLPEGLKGRVFLGERDFGDREDPELERTEYYEGRVYRSSP